MLLMLLPCLIGILTMLILLAVAGANNVDYVNIDAIDIFVYCS